MIGRILLIALLCSFSLASAAELKTYIVEGNSMAPVLVAGDTVIVSNGLNEPARKGELLSIRIGTDKPPLVKRVVAVEGDRVEFSAGAILVNGKNSGEFDPKRWQATIKQLERSGWIVPAGFLLILGDNPANSRDSRRLGLISTGLVEGKVVRVIKKLEQ